MDEPKLIEGTATRRAPKTPAWQWAYLLAVGGLFFYGALVASNWNWTIVLGGAIGGLMLGVFLGATVWHRNDGIFRDPNER